LIDTSTCIFTNSIPSVLIILDYYFPFTQSQATHFAPIFTFIQTTLSLYVNFFTLSTFHFTADMRTSIIGFTLFAASLAAPTKRQAGGNLQTFTGALGGIEATPVENTGDATRPFSVKGDTFVNLGGALTRSCDQQANACTNAANAGDETLSAAECTAQKGV
jgi:hypothetical protein